MPNTLRSKGLFACAAACCIAVYACSSECKRGSTECVSDNLLRVCVPGSDGNTWLVTQCGAGEACMSGGSKPVAQDAGSDEDGGPGADASTSSPAPKSSAPLAQAACVGTCQVGAHECVSDAFARYCVNGGVWQLDPCAVGEKCSGGVCKVGQGKGSVQACVPGAKACASDTVEKVCDSDGTSWVETPCAANESCIKDHCAPDPSASCDSGSGSCLDAKTAVRCMGPGGGYKLEDCTGDAYCAAGRCRGAACVIGGTCIGSNQVRQCTDGSSYQDTQCGVNQVCQQVGDDARCVPLPCNPGTSACGDPRDPSVDKKMNFTTCVTGVGSGIPEWVKGTCTGNATCNPALANTSTPCSTTCTPGQQRCATDAVSGINDGTQQCDDNGKWGQVKTCNPGSASRLQCVVPVNPDASQLPKAVCAEPICAWIANNPNAGATGACEGDKLRECQPDGTLADAKDCPIGICRTLRSTTTADGRMPGACDTSSECEDGEQECADASGGVVTPRYRECANGRWGSALQTCANNGACYDTKDSSGQRKVVCGAACSPGSRHCNGNGQLEQCNDQGQWGDAKQCAAGTCRSTGNNDAACVLDCLPNAKLCAGSAVVAPDGFHNGTTQEITCKADGTRGAATNCPSGKVCRVTSSGVVLGCVDCIGPSAPGGNDEGTVDARCQGNQIQDCNDDNTWKAAADCGNGKSCVAPSSGTCGNCMGGSGMSIVCTQTNIQNDQNGATCMSLGYGAPSAWGNQPDCCANYQLGAGSATSFAYCN